MPILVVEDEVDYAEIIAELIRREGHAVIIAGSLEGARRVLRQVETIDLAILDVMLGDGSGMDFASEIRRARPGSRIMFLTSLSSASSVVGGFKAGAEDYIVKPFHPAEFIARVRVVMRRLTEQTRPVDGNGRTAAPFGMHGLYFEENDATAYLDGENLNCTPIEFRLLFELARVPGEVLSHAYLNDRIWQYGNLSDGTLLKGHISSLRRKLKERGGDGRLIRTVHGVGYRYSPD